MCIKIGIVGWGEIAREHVSHFASCGAELGGVVSRRKSLGLSVPVFQNLQEIVPYVDAVIITVPNHLHARLCLQAIKADKPVLVEKPLCIAESELLELEKSFQNLKVPVYLGYRLRWNPSVLALKKRIKNLRRVQCVYRLGIEKLADDKDWTRHFAITGGSFFTLGVHMLDIARWLAEAKGRALANLKAGATHKDDSADYPLDVWMSGTLPTGVEIVAGADVRGNADCNIALKIDADEGSYPDSVLPPPVEEDQKVEYAALIANFIQAVETKRVDKSYIEEILQTHRELLIARDLAQPVQSADA